MKHIIVTMSRGDEHRFKDWLDYHFDIGFDEINILLDNPCDGSADILRCYAEATGRDVHFEASEPLGEYFDDPDPAVRWERTKKWVQENEEKISEMGLPVRDPLSWRQYRLLPGYIEKVLKRAGKCWVALIDVDEYIVLDGITHISAVTENVKTQRLRILNFNVDMTGWDKVSSVLGFSQRWSRDAIVAFGGGWENRVKSIVTNEAAEPLISVHAVSRGPFTVLDPHKVRLLHFKFPIQGNSIAYDAKDEVLKRWKHSYQAGQTYEDM